MMNNSLPSSDRGVRTDTQVRRAVRGNVLEMESKDILYTVLTRRYKPWMRCDRTRPRNVAGSQAC